jgi:hypothetical protein
MVVEKGFRTWGFNLPNLNGTCILIFMQRLAFSRHKVEYIWVWGKVESMSPIGRGHAQYCWLRPISSSTLLKLKSPLAQKSNAIWVTCVF